MTRVSKTKLNPWWLLPAAAAEAGRAVTLQFASHSAGPLQICCGCNPQGGGGCSRNREHHHGIKGARLQPPPLYANTPVYEHGTVTWSAEHRTGTSDSISAHLCTWDQVCCGPGHSSIGWPAQPQPRKWAETFVVYGCGSVFVASCKAVRNCQARACDNFIVKSEYCTSVFFEFLK